MKFIKKISCMLIIITITFSCVGVSAKENNSILDSDILIKDKTADNVLIKERDIETEIDIYADLNEVIQNYRKMHNIDVSLLYRENDKETADELAEQIIVDCLISVYNLDIDILYEIYDEKIADELAKKYA